MLALDGALGGWQEAAREVWEPQGHKQCCSVRFHVGATKRLPISRP